MNKLVFFMLCSVSLISSQVLSEEREFELLDNIYTCGDSLLIIPQSISIFHKQDTLKNKIDYQFNQVNNKISFLNKRHLYKTIRLKFKYLNLKKTYFLYKKSTKPIKNKVAQFSYTADRKKTKNFFKQLNKEGSIFRAFKLNSNKDLVLESGINLSLNGKITDELEIKAVLNDESSPIQPEGSSQRLSEIDKVYLELNHKYFSTVLGDYNLNFQSDAQSSFTRRLNGLRLSLKTEKISTQSNFSSSRSSFNRMTLLTRNALQGPYKLEAKNKNKDILIIAGTEKIYLDGKELKRGLNHDYIIDYSNASIEFTSKQLIKANQVLIAEYQYVESFQRFQKDLNIHSVTYKVKDFSSKLSFLSEKDDLENPLDSEKGLSDIEKSLLKSAGSDINKASYSSISLSKDSTGFYQYIFSAENNDSILVYTANKNGAYNAVFSHVGPGNGRYERLSKYDNQYKYSGKGKGSYEPLILLSIPQKNEIILSENEYTSKNFSATVNLAVNNNDQNILSDLDNTGSRAFYLNSNLKYNLKETLFDEITLKNSISYRDKNFKFFDAVTPIYFTDNYGIFEENSNEFYSEIKNNIFFKENNLAINLDYDFLEFKSSVNAYSYRLSSDYALNETNLLKFSHKNHHSKDGKKPFIHNFKNSNLIYNFKGKDLEIRQDFIYENREILDNREYKIFKLKELAGLTYRFSKEFKLSYDMEFIKKELKDSSSTNNTIPFSESLEHGLNMQFNSRIFQNNFSLKYRKLQINDFFKNLSGNDKKKFFYLRYIDSTYQSQKSYLFENKLRYNSKNKKIFLNLIYRANSELAPKKEIVYRKVSSGFGNYRLDKGIYVPDDKGNYLRFILPTNDFDPVHKVSVILNSKMNDLEPESNKLFSNFSFDSRIKLSDENKSDNSLAVYSFSPNTFFSSSSTNSTVELNNIFRFYRLRKSFNIEYQQNYLKSLTKSFTNDLQGNNNTSIQNQHKLILSYLIHKRLNASSDFSLRILEKNVRENTDLNRNINAYSIQQKINYRPIKSILIQNAFEYKHEENNNSLLKITANAFINKLLIKYIFNERSYINTNYIRTNVNSLHNPDNKALPYEMMSGKKIGLNQEWNVESLYKISSEFFASLKYSGRKDVIDESTFHLLRFELRVIF